MWLSLAPVSSLAEEFYGVGSMSISLCSMSYMIMFILFSIPASWVIDKFGYRTALVTGAAITAVFGLLRAIFADTFAFVLTAQFILAIGQPFLLNLSTKVAADWFPPGERATAAGILTLAQYIGFVVPMAVAPIVAERSGIPDMFMLFAVIAIVSACIAILFATVKSPSAFEDDLPTIKEELRPGSLRHLFTNRPYALILFISFISIGIFNTLLTLLETILSPRGFSSEQAGVVGAVFVVAGIIGAVVLPILSDRLRIRIPFLVTAIVFLIPAYIGLTFVGGFFPVSVIAGIAGFTIMGVAPILFQHGSETAYPVQEGTSLGIILMMGQISGIAFIYLFEVLAHSTDSIIWPMLLFVAMTAATLPCAMRLKESKISAPANKSNLSQEG
ncbi:MFS transporter [Gorillibacterium massiliense]|uniref:MFS transporter n=1 Tax=Gorillibacterium massiliense TaxID=1280390 RepID=UPI0004B5A7D3